MTTADALLILQFAKGLRTSFDLKAPLALTTLPVDGATNVLLTASINIFFSEPMDAASLNAAVRLTDTVSSQTVPGTIQSSPVSAVAAFAPAAPLTANRLYWLTVSTAGTDAEGNHLEAAFVSSFRTQPQGTGVLISTNGFSGPINTLLPEPIAFRALNASGQPVKQVPVTFTAQMGAGVFEPSGTRQVVILTDDNGFARVSFRLGGQSTEHTVSITAPGFSPALQFSAHATPLPPVNLRVYSGNNQAGPPGGVATFPLVVEATDEGGNPVAGAMITFAVTQGQGMLGSPTAVTDSTGAAQTSFTFGGASGTVLVQASFPEMKGQAPVFDLLTLVPEPSSPTAIIGRVVDAQTLAPLHRVYVYLADSPSTWDWTDENGSFRLVTVPGPHTVDVDGFESGMIGGQLYPVVAIPVNAVEGQENSLGMPALLPRLDVESYIDVSDVQGGTLTLRSNPDWKLYVAPGQARFANGTGTGRLYVASVPPDKIPMPPAGGKLSRFFDTIQPLNVRFNPPAPVSFPNADNLPAGTVTDIYTLSYSSGVFLKTGRGQVSEDGRLIASLPGEGITAGGWHQAPPPRPPGTTCANGRVVDDKGKGIPGCTVTYAGVSGRTSPFGGWRICNLPANAPLAPLILCPRTDQCSVDRDGDGFCDEFERRYGDGAGGGGGGGGGGAGGGGGGGGGDGPEGDPEKKPEVTLEVFPEELYMQEGETAEILVRVLVDGVAAVDQELEATSDSPAVIVQNPIGTAHVGTLAVAVVGAIGAAPATVTVGVVGSAAATAYVTFKAIRIYQNTRPKFEFEFDTNNTIRAIHECIFLPRPPGREPPATYSYVKQFLNANGGLPGVGRVFFSESLLPEIGSYNKFDAAANVCLEKQPISQDDLRIRLRDVGIQITLAVPQSGTVDSAINLAKIVHDRAGTAGIFGAGPYSAINLPGPPDDFDRRAIQSAVANRRFLATNDDDILRIRKLVPGLHAIKLTPTCYPDHRTGSFCGGATGRELP